MDLKFYIARAVVYAATMVLGLGAAWASAAGFGTYDEASGLFTLSVNVNTFAAYLGAMIGSGGLALTAVVKGWGTAK